jgi:quercetin dioxygenase-like cupin family protein
MGFAMEKISLIALSRQQLEIALGAPSGRSATTIFGGHEHALRQTVIALASGRTLDDHQSPGEATVQVLHGRVQLVAGDATWDGMTGDHLVVPPGRHMLHALQDAVVLLTVSMSR